MNEQKYTKEEIDAKSEEIYHILFPKIGSKSWQNVVDNAPSNVYRGAFLRSAYINWVLYDDENKNEEKTKVRKEYDFLVNMYTKEDWRYASLSSGDPRGQRGCAMMAERAPDTHPEGRD